MTNLAKHNKKLFSEIKHLIEESRRVVAQTVNSVLTSTYWNIGKKINDEILKHQRAEYGEQILPTLAAKLVEQYGNGFSEKTFVEYCNSMKYFPTLKLSHH